MTTESLFFPFLLLEYAQFLQAFSGQGGLFEFALSLTTLPMLIQNLEEIL